MEVTVKLLGAADGTMVKHTIMYVKNSQTTGNWVLSTVKYCCLVLQCKNGIKTPESDQEITDGKNL